MDTLNQIQQDISEMRTDIALLINKTEANHVSLRNSIDRNYELTKKHDTTLYGNGVPGLTSKIEQVKDLRRELVTHFSQDKWLFGTIITIILFILGKVFLMQ